jgi:quercetin dioxygenase-like cupin family protein
MRWRKLIRGVTAAGLLLAANAVAGEQPPAHHAGAVEMRGVVAAKKFEAEVEGFLAPLNHRFNLRATEAEFEPGALLGDHLHAGPGIRYVLAGELTFVHADTGAEKLVRAGEYIYESGAESLQVYNRGGEPARLLIFELLPADLEGSPMQPLERRAELERRGEALREQLCAEQDERRE